MQNANSVEKIHGEKINPILRTINYGGRLLSLEQPLVMGILNVTENSFYAKSQCHSQEQVRERAKTLIAEGADIIDIGACSTKPGSQPVTQEVELARLRETLSTVKDMDREIPISIDTYRAQVADSLIDEFGALIINDISSGEMDSRMFSVVAKHRVPYILTHIQGTPTDMQRNPHYEDVVQEVLSFFAERVDKLRAMGLSDLIIDPGFGFGKSIDHNYTLLKNLDAFHSLGFPILAGVSRKSMIYKLLDSTPSEALLGTQTVDTIALLNGADIIRVHDVKPAVEAVRIVECYRQQPDW